MQYEKVLSISKPHLENDLLVSFDFIKRMGNEYLVFADGRVELRFPVKTGYGIRPIKSITNMEYDVTFIYYKYQEDE